MNEAERRIEAERREWLEGILAKCEVHLAKDASRDRLAFALGYVIGGSVSAEAWERFLAALRGDPKP